MAKFIPYTLGTQEEKDFVAGAARARQYGCIVSNKTKRQNHSATWRIRETQTNSKKDVMQIIFPDGFDFSANFSNGDIVHVSSAAFSASGKVLSFSWESAIVKEDAGLAYDGAATGRPAAPERVKKQTPEAGDETEDGEAGEVDSGGGSGGRESTKVTPKEEAADVGLKNDKLDSQAAALTNSYNAAEILTASPGVPSELVASINSVITNELAGIKVTGNVWTPVHSQLLRQTAGLLLNNVSNPELNQFVQSYDAEISKGDAFSESAGSLGITRRGAEALKSFVIANMNTQPQKGIAQLILRDQANSEAATLLPGGPSFLASAWSLIFGLRAEFRRIEELRKIAGSPVMRYPWPPRDDRNFSDSPAEDSSVGPNLTLRVWTQADRDDKLGLGGNTVVLTFEADSSSFAKKIEDLPSILRLRTATRAREDAVRPRKEAGGSKK